jgi:hypothetical protein
MLFGIRAPKISAHFILTVEPHEQTDKENKRFRTKQNAHPALVCARPRPPPSLGLVPLSPTTITHASFLRLSPTSTLYRCTYLSIDVKEEQLAHNLVGRRKAGGDVSGSGARERIWAARRCRAMVPLNCPADRSRWRAAGGTVIRSVASHLISCIFVC